MEPGRFRTTLTKTASPRSTTDLFRPCRIGRGGFSFGDGTPGKRQQTVMTRPRPGEILAVRGSILRRLSRAVGNAGFFRKGGGALHTRWHEHGLDARAIGHGPRMRTSTTCAPRL